MDEGSEQEPAKDKPAPFNWKRYWIRSALWMLAFNILAFVLAWFFILPHLHPEAFAGH